ncbi:protein-tyrosine phosphatase family protein [Peristeroidobacter agariperforans]|uniref:protein-tyrosine phosphatase family protein n=1 Tax=Peristeroidobacter agariperforans TaxID=268404 RepID=UPI00101C1CFE|nr:dual specificity protein phosphatase family protein [Peristeroidobacter agariperforans]
MQPTLYEVERIGTGRLAVMGRPRAGDWASDEFAGLARLGVTDIVSLLEPSEAHELDLAEEPAYCAAAGIRFYSFPIKDRGVPTSSEDLARLACRLYHSCAAGRFAAVHCRAGIGRSGLVGAAVLIHGGFTVRDALSAISKARGVQVPDTNEQGEWLSRYRSAISRCDLNQLQPY